jgi:hypothetical protein
MKQPIAAFARVRDTIRAMKKSAAAFPRASRAAFLAATLTVFTSPGCAPAVSLRQPIYEQYLARLEAFHLTFIEDYTVDKTYKPFDVVFDIRAARDRCSEGTLMFREALLYVDSGSSADAVQQRAMGTLAANFKNDCGKFLARAERRQYYFTRTFADALRDQRARAYDAARRGDPTIGSEAEPSGKRP